MAEIDNFTHLTAKHFYWVRSLQDTAAVSVIGNIFVNNMFDSREDVLEKLRQVNLPLDVINRAKRHVRPIMEEVRSWVGSEIEEDDDDIDFESALPLETFISKYGLRWKWCGVLDYEQMAQCIVMDESLAVDYRFDVACRYCFSADLRSLWLKLSDEKKADKEEIWKIGKYWKAFFKEELPSLIEGTDFQTENGFGMSAAFEVGNSSAIAYFWSRMTEIERSQKLIEYAGKTFQSLLISDAQLWIVPYFVVQMNADQQIELICDELLTHDFSGLLTLLLFFPFEELFMPMFNLARDLITAAGVVEKFESGSLEILRWALSLVKKCESGSHMEHVILHIWATLPRVRKNEFYDLSNFDKNMSRLFNSNSKVCLHAILDGAGEYILRNITFSEEFSQCICHKLDSKDCDFVRVILEYLLPRNLQDIRIFENNVYSYICKLNKSRFHWCKEWGLKPTWMSVVSSRLETITDELLNDETSSDVLVSDSE